MNLIIVQPQEISGNELVLVDQRARHIHKVLRCRPGDNLRVGVLNGPMGTGRIISMDQGRVCLSLRLDAVPPPAPVLDLILALPRPVMLKRILVQAVTLGVNHIYLINANRVEKSFFSSSLIAEDGWREFLLKGLEQAVDTRIPGLSVHQRFRPFIEDVLPPVLARRGGGRIVAHPGGGAVIPAGGGSRAFLAIGPEGGWVDFEIEKFQAAGFGVFSPGPRIMRVDTAVPALMAQVNMALGLARAGGR
ncbi:Ribosomal RNA small subunit methyltransferase E [hydrothermal vent metagenome]|uniref:16S rRNA (uracil(1498)-N(3))-methyltransferase n=1 Tax=hydrothermal vent metagenome TaxID=652676 RepID=A0A3B0VCF1_9ZZZZ